MAMDIERAEIMHYLVNKLLLERLELADAGYNADDFTEDTLLLDAQGLNLDSVDALDFLVGLERKYKLEPVEIDRDFIDVQCVSIASVIDMVKVRMRVAA
jgi:acyl carrier protein